eukprot:5397693-Pleurochrysis_carterae.AAC.1
MNTGTQLCGASSWRTAACSSGGTSCLRQPTKITCEREGERWGVRGREREETKREREGREACAG